MAHGSQDYYKPDAQLVSTLTKLDTNISKLTLIISALSNGSNLLDALDALDGTMDGKLTLAQLNSAECEMLAKLAGIDTSVQTGGDLINKLDALDGTMDGRLTLTELNSAACNANFRPKYGGALRVEGSETVTANDETSIVSVPGKGMLYGGVVWLWHDSTQKNSAVKLNIDGNWVSAGTLAWLNRCRIDRYPTYGIYILEYNKVDYRYSVGVSFGFTFETGFEVSYVENHGETPDVCAEIIYALI